MCCIVPKNVLLGKLHEVAVMLVCRLDINIPKFYREIYRQNAEF